MPLPPLADVEALAVRLGVALTPSTPAYLRAQAVLEDASAAVRAYASGLVPDTTWTTDGELDDDLPEIVSTITLAVAMRVYQNPSGAVQASVGDVSVSYGRGEAAPGAFELTRAEKVSIRQLLGAGSVGSINLETDMLGPRDPLYAPTEGDDIPIGPVPWLG